MPFNRLSESDKQRLATAFYHLRQTSAYGPVTANVNWDQAAIDFKPSGKPITGVSFKTHVGRLLGRGFARLNSSDKHRLAAAFVNIKTEQVLKTAMSSVNWKNASRDFQSGGSRISAASFKTHIGRLMKRVRGEAEEEGENEQEVDDDNGEQGNDSDQDGSNNALETGQYGQQAQVVDRSSPVIKEEAFDNDFL